MNVSKSIAELVAAAQANAKAPQDRISEFSHATTGPEAEQLRAATVELEKISVDIYSVFEARMQHHFKRGPFSRKLQSLLVAGGETDLAERIRQYYLAINVLKHGKGDSYRELAKEQDALVVLRPAQDVIEDDTTRAVGLVDVTDEGFFDGLTAAILEAYLFLEQK
jgi:hypothetical protein